MSLKEFSRVMMDSSIHELPETKISKIYIIFIYR